jgi:hypothetical protein
MNISIDLQNISLTNVVFSEKKLNVIMDGSFTKILYSNEFFTMNGLYILFPIIKNCIEKNFIKFNPYQSNNLSMIQEFSKIEQRILEYYKTTFNCKSKNVNLLSKQMYYGSMKLYKELNGVDNGKKSIQYIIKISGVWETYDGIGLTFKLIEVNENYI